MSNYLSLADYKANLLRLPSQQFTLENMPDDFTLELALENAESLMEDWVGRRLVPTSYTETLRTDYRGYALLKHSPVVSVEDIILVPIQQFGYTATPLSLGPFLANWWEGRTLKTGRPEVTIRVTYTAGIDPLPRIIGLTFFQLAKEILIKGGGIDTGFLYQPTSDVQSISLPGGISKSFKVADVKTGKEGGPALGTTALDRILSPINRYRQAYLT